MYKVKFLKVCKDYQTHLHVYRYFLNDHIKNDTIFKIQGNQIIFHGNLHSYER